MLLKPPPSSELFEHDLCFLYAFHRRGAMLLVCSGLRRPTHLRSEGTLCFRVGLMLVCCVAMADFVSLASAHVAHYLLTHSVSKPRKYPLTTLLCACLPLGPHLSEPGCAVNTQIHSSFRIQCRLLESLGVVIAAASAASNAADGSSFDVT